MLTMEDIKVGKVIWVVELCAPSTNTTKTYSGTLVPYEITEISEEEAKGLLKATNVFSTRQEAVFAVETGKVQSLREHYFTMDWHEC